jgi:cellulose synthase/poly-beta-1,6-N-acetylglucosamine synthase-like glycosyltransferase
MNVRSLGYKVHYDPEAKAVDYPASTVAGEFKRRVRIATGSFLALSSLLKVPLHGFTAFAFVSHKLLRWIVPLLLILVFASNLFLLGKPLYRVSLALQAAIYAPPAAASALCAHRLFSGGHEPGVSGRPAAMADRP